MLSIKNRQEIALALNFGKYPVLTIDIAKDEIKGFSGSYRSKDKISFGHYGRGELAYYSDEKKLVITSGGACLSSSFGYSDIIEMIDNAHSIRLEPSQEVIVIIYNSATRKTAYPVLTKVSSYLRQFCMTPLEIEGDFSNIIAELEE